MDDAQLFIDTVASLARSGRIQLRINARGAFLPASDVSIVVEAAPQLQRLTRQMLYAALKEAGVVLTTDTDGHTTVNVYLETSTQRFLHLREVRE